MLMYVRFNRCQTVNSLALPNAGATLAAVQDVESAAKRARAHLAPTLIRVGNEDQAAFSILYNLTVKKLFGICLSICGDRGAAEDVLHEVYLTIWRRAGGWEPGRASPISWLATIARNRAIDWRRSAAPRAPSAGEEMREMPDVAPTAEETLIAADEARHVVECLSLLEERQQLAIQCVFFGGLTYTELAQKTDVPLATAKSRVRRGLLILRRCLDENGLRD